MAMDYQALLGRQVELSAPDGKIFRFQVAALLPYAGATYAVLAHEEDDGQLLVTHIEAGAENAPVFIVAVEEDIISAVLEKWTAQRVAQALAQEEDETTAGS
ncbi:MAG: hypothetical protein IJ189_11935 [Clostridia bacterium]|nr:hypothetical protein [Clostridia bacterium]